MNKRYVWITLAVVMFVSAGILVFYFFWANGYIVLPNSSPTTSYAEFTYPSLDTEPWMNIGSPTPTPRDASADYMDKENQDHEGINYNSPVDFAQLQAMNPDIVGWLYMNDPEISQPILRSSSDDSFYLSHGANKSYDRAGSIYMESQYNSGDFNDMVTMLYGHRMSSGAMFGNLQTGLEGVDLTNEPHYIVIYTPERMRIYRICATAPRDKKHVMHYNNFDNESVYNNFISQIYNQTGSAASHVNELKPQYGDRLLILSTCLRTDRTRRFLVIAKELT